MKKIYYLSTCSTCKKIMDQLPLNKFELQDIKNEPIQDRQLEEMAKGAGNYEQLFSRRAMKYRAMGLDKKELNEKDYKSLILKEYTFLKRPVVLLDDRIFIGSSKKTVEALIKAANLS